MRNKRSITLLALVAALALLAGACSSDTPGETATGDGSRLGQEDDKKKKKDGGGGAGGGKGGNKGPGGGDKKGSGGPGGSGGGGGQVPSGGASPPPASSGQAAPTGGGLASDGPPSPVDPSLARRSSFYEETSPDAKKEGALVPAYAEVVGCGIQGVGEQFEMHFEFNGAVPKEMPDKNTIMVIGFGISAGGNDTYGFTAQGNQEGWKAYAGAKDGARKFPGEFLIQGNKIIMRAPWSFINGPREFQWQINATWFRSVASTTHYSFDQCRNEEPGQFPS